MIRSLLLSIAFAIFGASAASAQGGGGAASPPLTVFLDCRAWCDFDLIREEITYVDWVRDRTAADIHLLVTSQDAGAGGSEYTLAFIGQRTMVGQDDTLHFTTNPITTDDERRRGLSQHIAAGLVPFVVRSGNAHLLRIGAAEAAATPGARTPPGRDPWRSWVFEIGVDGGIGGEALYKSTELNGSFEADRVTEAWKFNFEFDYRYDHSRITDEEYDDAGNVIESETFTNLQRDWSGNTLLVRSLGPHLSAGLASELRSNTFRNLHRALRVTPAIEYNFYPYSQATRRELIVRYGAGYEVNRYVDTTIFDRMRETLPLHVLLVSYESRQTWGSAEVSAEHRNYLSDGAKRNTAVSGYLSARLFKGFSANVNGEYRWIRDQITLRKGRGDQADLLLRRRELLTGFDYRLNMGLSYTFGSIFNNVVNPRF